MSELTLGYFLRRLGMWLLTIWIGATLIFTIPRLAPGDPITAMVERMIQQAGYIENSAELIEAWRARFGLDGPWHVQYRNYLLSMMRVDLGYSLANFPARVTDIIGRSLPWTLGMVSIATILSFCAGNLIGALMAWRRVPAAIRNILPVSLTFTSIPFFMFGILLISFLAFKWKIFPAFGNYGRGLEPGWNLEFIFSVIHHGLLPVLSIVVTSMGFWALGMRGMMVTTDGEDYMILANAKGLRSRRIFWFYGIRNSMLPQVTALALNLGAVAGGSLLVELIFGYPGLGYFLYQAIISADYTVIQGIVFMLIVGVATAVLILDLLYPMIDPRITYSKGQS